MDGPDNLKEVHLISTQRLICAGYVHVQRYFHWSDLKQASDDIDEGRRIAALANIEISSLVTTMGQLRRWLERLSEDGIIPREAFAPLKEIDAMLREVRDMREHLDEYQSGQGRAQQRYVHRFNAPDGRVFGVPADWMFHFEGKALVGGRVALADVLGALKHAADTMEPLWVLPWKPLELCAMVRKVNVTA